MYKCYLTAGDKMLCDHNNNNLSSVILTWTYRANTIEHVYSTIMKNINMWSENDTNMFHSLFWIDPYCYHMSNSQPMTKIFDPLLSAILWDNTISSIDTLKRYLKEFYWNISHSTTYCRGQAAISKWIVEFLFKKNKLNASSFHVDNVMADQYALLCFFEDDFEHEFIKIS